MSESNETPPAAPTGEPISVTGRNVAWGVAAIAALFSIAVGVVLAFTYFSSNTITEDKLTGYREILAKQPDNEVVKQQMREIDAEIRQQYHARIDRYETGGFWLVIGLGVMLLSGAIGAELGRELPAPQQEPEPEPIVQKISRASIAFGVGLLAVVGVFIAWQGQQVITDQQFATAMAEVDKPDQPEADPVAAKTGDSDPTPPTNGEDASTDDKNGEEADKPKPKPKSDEPQYASYEAYAKQWATFRGFEGRAVCNFKDVPQEWDGKTGKNIAWKSAIPLEGLSSPIVWDDKIFLTGATRQKREVYCYDAKTGKKLWTGTYKSDPKAPSDYDVYDSVGELMHAASTPVADGKHVYAMFANGEVVCFDFDGKLVWSKYVASPMDNMYGNSASLLKYKDTVIALIDGPDLGLYGLDGKTGERVWSGERGGNTWASPILIKTPKGQVQVIVASNPVVEAFDPNTGENLWRSDSILGGDMAPTPTYDGKRVYAVMKDYALAAFDPDQKGKLLWELWELDYASLPDTTSPVSDGKRVWCYYQSDLVAAEADAEGDAKKIYEAEVEQYSAYGSPTIVNGKLWLFTDGGETVVGSTGDQWKADRVNPLAEFRIDASPAFAPGKAFFRVGKHLYCIAKTEK